MQSSDIGRNDPCPCGSGRKFKKCCLEARRSSVIGSDGDLDVAAIVDAAIVSDDWERVHELFDDAYELFQPMAPLEHVRFRDDLVGPRYEDLDVARLCSAGWLQSCEQAIVDVLDRYELEPHERDGLRMALHLLRRFGARSPVVEEIARLQSRECQVRSQRFAETMARLGVTAERLRSACHELL